VWRRGKDASSERREGGTDTGHVHRLRPLLRPILVRRQQSPGSHKLGRPRGTRGCHPISKKNPPKRREREGVVCESACGARVGGGRSFVVQTGNPRATRNFLEDRWAEKLGNPRWATKGPSTRPPVVRGGGGKVGSRDCAVQGSLGKPAGPWPGAGAGAHLGPWLKLLDPSGRRFCWLYRGCYSSLGGLVLVAVTSGVPFLFGLLSLSPELMTW
jgi:hypothetical protein